MRTVKWLLLRRQRRWGTASLYVGDLDPTVTDSQLFEAFSQMGRVVSVGVSRDMSTRRSLDYDYVNCGNSQDAARALNGLNFIVLNGKAIRVTISAGDPKSWQIYRPHKAL